MMISHKYKMIFIHVHRTGGTTLSTLLRQRLGKDIETISEHGNAKGPEADLLDAHPDYFTFGFVRNPWERLLSWYKCLNNAGTAQQPAPNSLADFEHFLTDIADRSANDPDFHFNQLDYFTDANGVLRTDFIGRFEDYEADITRIFKTFGYELSDIPKLNTTPSANFRDYYSNAAKNIVAERCAEDIAHFGYRFEAN